MMRWLTFLVVFGIFVLIILGIQRLLQPRPTAPAGEREEDVVNNATALALGVIIICGVLATLLFFAGLHFIFGMDLF